MSAGDSMDEKGNREPTFRWRTTGELSEALERMRRDRPGGLEPVLSTERVSQRMSALLENKYGGIKKIDANVDPDGKNTEFTVHCTLEGFLRLTLIEERSTDWIRGTDGGGLTARTMREIPREQLRKLMEGDWVDFDSGVRGVRGVGASRNEPGGSVDRDVESELAEAYNKGYNAGKEDRGKFNREQVGMAVDQLIDRGVLREPNGVRERGEENRVVGGKLTMKEERGTGVRNVVWTQEIDPGLMAGLMAKAAQMGEGTDQLIEEILTQWMDGVVDKTNSEAPRPK